MRICDRRSFNSFGPNPLDEVTLDTYCRRNGVVYYETFCEVIKQLDDMWMRLVMKSQKAEIRRQQQAAQKQASQPAEIYGR